jgi:hypothetical protein
VFTEEGHVRRTTTIFPDADPDAALITIFLAVATAATAAGVAVYITHTVARASTTGRPMMREDVRLTDSVH